MKMIFWILRIIGIFLILDGILSVYFQQADGCLNNTLFGNIVRVIRAIFGFSLILLTLNKKIWRG